MALEVVQVRYARELGWLELWDPFDRRWLEVWAKDCPPSWRRAAFLVKQQRSQRGIPREIPAANEEASYAF